MLAEVALPGSIRSQQGAYGVHPALLDACFQAVGAHPDLHGDTTGTLMLPLGVRGCARYALDPQRALLLRPADQRHRRPRSRSTSTCSTSTARCC